MHRKQNVLEVKIEDPWLANERVHCYTGGDILTLSLLELFAFVRLRVAEMGHKRFSDFPSVVSPVIIKEWAAYKGKSPQTPELVEALAFREWT